MKHLLVIFLLVSTLISSSKANDMFRSNYPCSDSGMVCISSGKRVVDGMEVYKDCWQWQYSKTCQYPSKDDCKQYARCYSLGQRDCLLRDSDFVREG